MFRKFLTIFLFVPFQSSFAEDLSQCVTLALQNNAELNVQKEEFNALNERRYQSRSTLLPTVSLSISRNKTDQDRIDFGNQPVKQKYTTEADSLTVRQPLYNSKRFKEYQKTKSDILVEKYLLEYKKDLLRMKVIESYIRLLKFYETAEIIEDKTKLLSQQKQAAKKSLKAGFGTITEVTEIEAAYDKARVEMISSEQNIKVELNELRYLIGKKILDIGKFSGENKPFSFLVNKAESEWKQDALKKNKQILSMRQRIESAKIFMASQKRARYPTLDLSFQVSNGSSESSFFLGTETKSRSIGINLLVPLYQGGSMSSIVREAAFRLNADVERLRYEKEEVEKKIQRAFFSLSENVKIHDALLTAVKSSKLALDSNKKSAAAGVRRQLDILISNQNLISVQNELASSKLNIVLTWLQLNMLAGSMDPTIITKANTFLK